MNGLLGIQRFIVPRSVMARGHEHLRAVGQRGLEGFVLWAGRVSGSVFDVQELVIPDQTGYQTPEGVCVTVDGSALHRVNVRLFERGLTLGAQLHSHPREAYHSPTDDAYAIATMLGSLSVVVPDFAARPCAVDRCAVYRLSPAGWQRLRPHEARRLIELEG